MESFRHLALGCCVLSALAGMLRLFWPDNGFKSVINAVLVLYILTAGIQMLGGIDWDSIVLTLRSLPAGQNRPSADFSAYSRELGLTASVELYGKSCRVRASAPPSAGRTADASLHR